MEWEHVMGEDSYSSETADVFDIVAGSLLIQEVTRQNSELIGYRLEMILGSILDKK